MQRENLTISSSDSAGQNIQAVNNCISHIDEYLSTIL